MATSGGTSGATGGEAPGGGALLVPPCFRSFELYAQKAQELETSHPIVAFFLRRYVSESVMKLLQKSSDKIPGGREYLEHSIEAAMHIRPVEVDKESRIAAMNAYCNECFNSAVADDEGGTFNIGTVKKFFTASLLFDALGDDLAPEDDDRRMYAKQKALYIKKCLDMGLTPQSGPLDADALEAVGFRTGTAAAFLPPHQSPTAPRPSAAKPAAPTATEVPNGPHHFAPPPFPTDPECHLEPLTPPVLPQTCGRRRSFDPPLSLHPQSQKQASYDSALRGSLRGSKQEHVHSLLSFDEEKIAGDPAAKPQPQAAAQSPPSAHAARRPEIPKQSEVPTTEQKQTRPSPGRSPPPSHARSSPPPPTPSAPVAHVGVVAPAAESSPKSNETFSELMSRSRAVEDARRRAQFSISALNYGTVEEAIRHMEEAILILEPHRD